MSSFFRLELPLQIYGSINTVSFFKLKFYNALYWGFCIALLCAVFAN